jgi:hypothetical protein
MQQPRRSPPDRPRLLGTVGCLAWLAGLGIFLGPALLITSIV